ncbi:MAG: rod shape-determining protein MreD ['Candidatus Kapabacteria' thiocyanatum]|uniref:Rod shape-determining protein MreD n=1 Tax=Candidatus Kapaibacterium thiocyanatum TaxID=1895771 RepID=A0A1M3L6L6_9BACT|nr:rod shape-determining protein MreD ['Candidatus Kapabacteria' thiocyanatum]OJX61207.1 MAG: rod shape-determining protein MreD ['Candidatus Kapabacteria' thiocyanatum]
MNVLFDRTQFATNPALRFVAYAVVAMVLSVIHVVFLRFVAVSSVTPDLLLILTVWIALVEGQFVGMFAGFASGILFDIVSADVLGSNALAKTVAAFVAGYFWREGFAMQTIGSYRFLLIVALCGGLHNVLYFFFYVKPMQISFPMFFLTYGVATTLYTTVAAVFPMLYVNRKKEW